MCLPLAPQTPLQPWASPLLHAHWPLAQDSPRLLSQTALVAVAEATTLVVVVRSGACSVIVAVAGMLRVEVGAVSVAVTVAEFVLVLVEVDVVVVTVGVVRKYWEQALLMIGPPKAFRSPFRAGKSRRLRSSMLQFRSRGCFAARAASGALRDCRSRDYCGRRSYGDSGSRSRS